MGHSAVLAKRFEGKMIPDGWFAHATSQKKEYISFVCVVDGEIRYDTSDIGDESIANIKQTMAEETIPFWLVVGDGCSTTEDRQPFIMLRSDNQEPMCVVALEGTFTGFDGLEESRSDEWKVANYLIEKIGRVFKEKNEDMAALVEYLQDKFNQREILNNCCPLPAARCEILLVFSNGQDVSLVKGSDHVRFEWGEVSQALGYSEGAAAPTKPKGNLTGRKTSTASSVPPTGQSQQPSSTATTTVKAPNMPTDTAIGAAMTASGAGPAVTDDRPFILPPKGRCESAKDLQEWHMHYVGFCPEGWDNAVRTGSKGAYIDNSHKAVPVKPKKALWEDQARWKQGLDKGSYRLVEDVLNKKNGKATETEGGSPIKVTMLTPAQREKLTKVFLPKIQNVDDNNSFVADPTKLAEAMKDKSLFTEEIGIELTDTFSWSEDTFLLLCKTEPEAAKRLLSQYRFLLWQKMGGTKAAAGKVAM